ncbi:MAG: hypothetical protein J6T08_11145 [Lentisphaeria bacterium]|nr:hypothetical protein [Lentisphaeria bacterium]
MGTCVLIDFDPDAHEAGSAPKESRNEVYVIEKGVTMSETYQAGGIGLNPEVRLLIPMDEEYNGERILEYKGERWKVIRPARNEYNGVLLSIQRITGNSVELPEPEDTEEAQEA